MEELCPILAFIQPVILYVSAVDCTLFDVVVSSLELISSPPLKGIYEGLLRGLGAPARYDWPVITLSLILKYRYLVCVCVCVSVECSRAFRLVSEQTGAS